jgi:hypothetical protein
LQRAQSGGLLDAASQALPPARGKSKQTPTWHLTHNSMRNCLQAELPSKRLLLCPFGGLTGRYKQKKRATHPALLLLGSLAAAAALRQAPPATHTSHTSGCQPAALPTLHMLPKPYQ